MRKTKKRERYYLDVKISNFFLKEKSYHFLIILQKKVTSVEPGASIVSSGEDKIVDTSEVSRNFNSFHNLFNEMRQEGYNNLPKLPDKTLL